MDDDMAPPNKRRRLSGPLLQSTPSRSEFIVPEPTPTLRHSVEELEHRSSSTATRAVPQHIQEVHLQIQERPVLVARDDRKRLHRRQGTAIESVITTIDVNGNPVLTTFTIGAGTTTVTGSPTTGSQETSTPEEDTSASPTQSSANDTTTSKPSQTGGTLSNHLTASDNSTSAHKPTHETARASEHASRKSSVYLATLSNSKTVTITRHHEPYVTTFSDGEVSTICDLQSRCRISTHKSEATRKSIGATSPSNFSPSQATSAAFVGATNHGQGTAASPASSSSTSTSHHNNNDTTPPAGTIAGGVVGGAAGLAVILLVALVLLRWYKRRSQQGHHALPPSSAISPDPDHLPSSKGPGMAERAGLMPLANAVPGFFRHPNRSQEGPPSGERGFTKISGRKLPSAFSEGMSSGEMNSPPPGMPLSGPLNSTSFYRDSYGFYGGEGVATEPSTSPDEGAVMGGEHGEMTLSPGPQRRPTVHTGGPYVMSPSSSVPNTPRTPNLQTVPGSPPDTAPAVARSDTPSTFTDNRSSRFTEEV